MLSLVALLLVSLIGTASVAADGHRNLFPIGGGYEVDPMAALSLIAAEGATDGSVDFLVLPSSYGNDPDDLEENREQAEFRTDQFDAACDAAVSSLGLTCTATLLDLFLESQVDGEEGTEAINLLQADSTDGVYILGGDQTIAMEILANSDVETAMAEAYERGVVFGGTSAGAAVESTTMLAGYTNPGWPYNALEKDKIIIWWSNDQTGDADYTRGLIFASENAITDQHFYERGRYTRLLNVVAQSDEKFGGESKVGIGVDWGTGVQITEDTFVHNVVGASSVAIVDGEALGATFDWVGPNQTLSARDLVTHIVAPGDDVVYNLVDRTVSLDAEVLPIDAESLMSHDLSVDGRATLILGGDVSMSDFESSGAAAFVDRVRASKKNEIVVVAVGEDAEDLAQQYVEGLSAVGLANYNFTTVLYDGNDPKTLNRLSFGNTAGVVLVGQDQSMMGTAISDAAFVRMVERAVSSAPVVLTDKAMTAAMGDVYVSTADPTRRQYQDAGIEAFQEDGVTISEGLGIVEGAAFQGRNTYDQHWGRLYALSMYSPDTMVYGISEMTAIVIDGDGATVVGERSVVALDGSQATFIGDNGGAFSALNVVMDLYAPGDVIE